MPSGSIPCTMDLQFLASVWKEIVNFCLAHKSFLTYLDYSFIPASSLAQNRHTFYGNSQNIPQKSNQNKQTIKTWARCTMNDQQQPNTAEADSSHCPQRRQCIRLKNSAICQSSGVFLFTFLFCVTKLQFSPQMAEENDNSCDKFDNDACKPDKMFTLKKWNAVALWSWDVECDTCAICRVQVMGKSTAKYFYISSRIC